MPDGISTTSSSFRVFSLRFRGRLRTQTFILSETLDADVGLALSVELVNTEVVFDRVRIGGFDSVFPRYDTVFPLADLRSRWLPLFNLRLFMFSAEAEDDIFLLGRAGCDDAQRFLSRDVIFLEDILCLVDLCKEGSLSLPFVLLKLRRKNVARLKYVLLGGVGSGVESFFSFDLRSEVKNRLTSRLNN